MHQPIVGFHVDEYGDWVADLQCGHGQHVRHQPPIHESSLGPDKRKVGKSTSRRDFELQEM